MPMFGWRAKSLAGTMIGVGYGFELVRVAAGLTADERRAAAEHALGDEDFLAGDDLANKTGPSAEQLRLAELLKARFPDLRVTHQSNAHVELTEPGLGIQITLFERSAGIEAHVGGFAVAKRIDAARFAWRCLELLEHEGSFATIDQQVGRVLDLARDFELVLSVLGGRDAVAAYQRSN
jgi:hypothetical protein